MKYLIFDFDPWPFALGSRSQNFVVLIYLYMVIIRCSFLAKSVKLFRIYRKRNIWPLILTFDLGFKVLLTCFYQFGDYRLFVKFSRDFYWVGYYNSSFRLTYIQPKQQFTLKTKKYAVCSLLSSKTIGVA